MSAALSIVLAIQEGTHRLDAVVGALAFDLPPGVEVLLVWAADDAEAGRAARALASPERPWLRMEAAPSNSLVPDLWAHGIPRTTAPRVALTVVHCVPPRGWIDRLLRADLRTWAALGGPIDQRPGSDDLGWAIYLLRYAGVATESVGSGTASFTGVAADNAVYSRAALSAVSNTWEDGFWEPTVHDALRAAGQLIGLDPALAVLHDNGYSARGFVLQRLLHGYRFGRDRARRHGPLTAGLYAAASPAVPLLFGRKVVARALGLREARRHLPGALPWLLVFLAAWSAGEVLGAHAGALRGRGP